MHFKTFFPFVLSAVLPAVVRGQSCVALAWSEQKGGPGPCTGIEISDASQTGPGWGNCETAFDASCVTTESNTGDCAIHLFSDLGCNTPIGGGNTVMCGDPSTNADFDSFRIEC